jgi:hypothetical protein
MTELLSVEEGRGIEPQRVTAPPGSNRFADHSAVPSMAGGTRFELVPAGSEPDVLTVDTLRAYSLGRLLS